MGFSLTPQKLFLLFVIMIRCRFEPLFASLYRLWWREASQEKFSNFHKVKFCPELEIRKIAASNRCHLQHVAHNFHVVFSDTFKILVIYYDVVAFCGDKSCAVGAIRISHFIWVSFCRTGKMSKLCLKNIFFGASL